MKDLERIMQALNNCPILPVQPLEVTAKALIDAGVTFGGKKTKKLCNVNPSAGECLMCCEMSECFDEIPNCAECQTRKDVYEILSFFMGITGKVFAIVQSADGIHKVEIDRLINIRDVTE